MLVAAASKLKKMSSAVHNLQKAIVSGQKSLAQLLRETKLIAAKLGLEDVEKWVDLELTGYPDEVDPPTYRSFTTNHLEVRNPYHGWQHAGNMRFAIKARQPLPEIENL